jgi:hypothetical protein
MSAERLSKICGLLTSAFAGERANAAEAASALLRDMGMTWAELIEAAFREGAPKAKPRQKYRPSASLDAFMAAHASQITPWETGFLKDLAARPRQLTTKQIQILKQVAVKVGEADAVMMEIFGAGHFADEEAL